MTEAIDAARKAEDECDTLKRKYEPDTGILLDKMLKLMDDDGMSFMRLQVHTGEYLMLTLIPRVRNVPNWMFMPNLEGHNDNKQDFGSYGVYEICIGDGGFCHDCLVHFDSDGVRITVNHGPGGGERPLTIEEFNQPAAFTVSTTAAA